MVIMQTSYWNEITGSKGAFAIKETMALEKLFKLD